MQSLSLSLYHLALPKFYFFLFSSRRISKDIVIEEAEAGVFGKRQMFLPKCGTIGVLVVGRDPIEIGRCSAKRLLISARQTRCVRLAIAPFPAGNAFGMPEVRH